MPTGVPPWRGPPAGVSGVRTPRCATSKYENCSPYDEKLAPPLTEISIGTGCTPSEGSKWLMPLSSQAAAAEGDTQLRKLPLTRTAGAAAEQELLPKRQKNDPPSIKPTALMVTTVPPPAGPPRGAIDRGASVGSEWRTANGWFWLSSWPCIFLQRGVCMRGPFVI